ncbi:DUF2169 domain-containing protein [Labrenzia sp. VG12]|uniref:DUF2169 family type VI secretion system accessory protein n=1 Tax=Labrenzia sp. VG12 TaxID=2021862 RepID=UPI000B8C630E|nr:DUF2169 domain-containing protein [Labrenzia sp. VG12]ASP32181.1 hypothetical protein CHH27_02100 [Labrenzia sp. VG12]
MPAIVKPSKISATFQPHAIEGGNILTVSSYLLFDISTPYNLLTEQALWPMVAEQMPDGGIFDKGQLKPRAEMIIAGHALAPNHQPVTGLKVTARFGDRVKRLAVFGNRFWQSTDRGVEISAPEPFDKMPISELRAFGGQGHGLNPKGKGHKTRHLIEAGLDAPLPNIEDANRLILTPEDIPPPTHFGPLGQDNPQRLKLAGTYDMHWRDHVSPRRPDDYNPLFHFDAPEDQRFASYLSGGEPFSVTGMSRTGRPVEGTLPSFRMRGFIHRPDEDGLTEMAMVCDTVTLFPNVEKAVLTFRGITKCKDRFGDDIGSILLAVEHGSVEARPPEYYHRVFQLRSDPEDGYKHALSDFQLMPDTDPEQRQARRQARLAQARAERETFIENANWLTAKTLQDQGLPAELLPPTAAGAADDIPLVGLPTAEELASGDFDLAELIDDIERVESSLTQRAEDEFTRAELTMQALEDKLPDEVRGLLPEQRLTNNKSLADYPDFELDPDIQAALEGDIPVPGDLKHAVNEALAELETLGDTSDIDTRVSEALDAAFNPETKPDETLAKQCALGRARALRLPEGSLLYPIRLELEQNNLADLSLPDFAEDVGSALPDDLRQITDIDVSDLPVNANDADLDLDLPAQMPDSFGPQKVDKTLLASQTAHAMKSASGLIAKLNPSLVDADPGDPLLNLISSLENVPSVGPDETDLSMEETVRRGCQDLMSSLEESEEDLETILSAGRQKSPEAMFPLEPYLPEAARQIGTMVGEKLAGGHDFKGADLAGLDLRGLDFSGKDLSGTFFEQADLRGALFTDCRLDGAVFTSARLEEADFSGCALTGTNFSGAYLRSARFSAARLADCMITQADLSGVTAHGAILSQLTLLDCKLDFADFSGAHINGLTVIKGAGLCLRFCNAQLDQVVFLDLNLSEADFSCARLNRAAFTKVQAIDADFSRAYLTEAGFHGQCNLTGARFEAVKAADASWNDVLLEEALFLRADCNNCLFNKCNMQSVDGRAASFKQARFLLSDLKYSDFCAADFFAASLTQCDVRLASLRHSNLYAADFMDAKLTSCDLTNANMANSNIARPHGQLVQ